MPPLYRVSTADTFASESTVETVETVQEIDMPRNSTSTCDTYMDSPSLSSAYSTSPDTPSSIQTSFSVPDVLPWHKHPSHPTNGVAPGDDWGYDLYHPESKQSDSSSLKPKSVKSTKGFGFSRKKSVSDLTPGLAHLDPFKAKPAQHTHPKTAAPLTLNQIDMLRAPQVNRPAQHLRLQAPNQSRLAALAKFGSHKEQVTGAVKLVVRSKGDEADTEEADNDGESVFTTITTTSTSSGGSDIVPVFGRGGAGRAAGAKVTMQVYEGGSMSADSLNKFSPMQSVDDVPYIIGTSRSRGMSTSGKSGGKAFLGKMYGKIGSGSNDSQTDNGSGRGSIRSKSSASSNKIANWHLNPGPSASRDSLATIHSCPQPPKEEVIKSYGRGGAARKPAMKEKEPKIEEKEKHESRAVALIGRMRKSDKASRPSEATDKETEVTRSYGRGGAARKSKS